ncbi:hypothetical protein GCM10010869_59120 [Mesorhizobium tianshanense]|nr:hypothetical protein GCM10010869_59120 [Mesorhizobium tianshanense]
MPVRGALQRLVAEGAIESRANRTFALPVLNPQSLMEIAHIRSELEGMAVEAAVGNLDETDFKYLTDINHQMFDGTPDWTNYLELNRIFHFHIYRKAGMPRLLRLIEGMWLQIGPLLNFVATSSALAGGSETHRDLVRALAEKDARGARVTIQRDILVAARQIVVTLTEQRDGSDRAVAER